MNLKRALPAAIAAALLLTSAAQARSVTNGWSGQWTTDLGGGVTGTVYFAEIPADKGASQIQAMYGHPCPAPTTYYHGYYTDTGGSGGDSGQMVACTMGANELAGRYQNSDTSLSYPGGGLDIMFSSTEQTAFSGSYTADDPGYSGMTFPYSGTFQSDFQGDGCCTTKTTTSTTTTTTTTTTTKQPSHPSAPSRGEMAFRGQSFVPHEITVASGATITICDTGKTFTSIFANRSRAAEDSTLVKQKAPDHTTEWRLPGKGHKVLAPGNCGSFVVNNPTNQPIELHLYSEIQSRAKGIIRIEPAVH